jgi:uncharacterized protein
LLSASETGSIPQDASKPSVFHPEIKIQPSDKGGVGVFARCSIAAGTVVWAPCRECALFSDRAMRAMDPQQRGWVQEFGYGLAGRRFLVACGNGHLVNHSCDPNVLDYGLDFGVAIRNIAAGDEICVDYRTFVDDPAWVIDCACRAAGCLRRIEPDGSRADIIASWKALLAPVLPLIAAVPQPCHDRLKQISSIYRLLREDCRRYAWQEDFSIRCPGFLA